METKKGRLVGKQWTITLTEEERDVLLNIVACHMDLVLEPKIKEAGKKTDKPAESSSLQRQQNWRKRSWKSY